MTLARRWLRPNGWRDVLTTSLPLVASTAATSVMLFTDRMFLGRHSVAEVAAAVPAGMAAFTCACFFHGVVGYVNTFVAQYVGAGQPRRVGAAVGQGFHLALLSGAILAVASQLAGPLCAWADHAPAVQRLEASYFTIVMAGSVFALVGNALSCFYSGRGRTGVVMVVSLVGTAVNVPLDYAWINGRWGLPEWGIEGAAWATVVSQAVSAALYALVLLRSDERQRYCVIEGLVPDRGLFLRLLRYGLPAGMSFFLEIFAFTVFILLVGRLGTAELAATNVVFSINSLAFMPMLGFHIAVTTLVGQALGRNAPDEAEEATQSAFELTFAYMVVIGALYVFWPEPLLELFRSRDSDPAEAEHLVELGVVLLRFVALYSLFDACNLVYSGALKGAGDTRFTGLVTAGMALGLFVLPTYVGLVYCGGGLYTAWTLATVYTCSIALAFRLRYRAGGWKHLRVIETAV